MIFLGKVAPKSSVPALTFAWLIMLFFTVLMVILINGRYAHKEQTGGRVVTRDSIRLFTEQPGYVEQLLVSVGDKVQANQPLLHIRRADADFYHPATKGPGSDQQRSRLQQLLQQNEQDQQQAIQAEQRLRQFIASQQQTLQADLTLNQQIALSVERRLTLARQQRDNNEQLAADGLISQLSLQDAISRYETVLQEQAGNQTARLSTEQSLQELSQRAADGQHTLEQRLSELARSKADLQERIDSLEKSLQYTLFAPASGTVEVISAYNGDKTRPDQPLLLLKADTTQHTPATVLLNVSGSAIGFIQQGHEVMLRFDAFPYEHYGTVRGKILSDISGAYSLAAGKANAADDVYLVEVALQFAPDDKIAAHWLKDGMTVQASVRLQELNLLQWLFLPVVKAMQRNPDFFN